jgi:5-methylcytosine-specific restriction protein A
MPTINLLKHKKRDNTYNKFALQSFYQDKRWKRLRSIKFKNNPLCERCLEKVPPVVRQTDEVHHKIPIDIQHPDVDLIYDYDNLQSLCNECHVKVHGGLRGMNPIEKQIAERREVR